MAGTVEGVQACYGQVGRVADIVQPCGGLQEIGVSAENSRQPARGNSCTCAQRRGAAGE